MPRTGLLLAALVAVALARPDGAELLRGETVADGRVGAAPDALDRGTTLTRLVRFPRPPS